MATLNKNYENMPQTYLFSEIAKRVKAFQEKNPQVSLLKLGIGNTTESLPQTVIEGLHQGVEKLANNKTYTGYGEEQGDVRLRKALSDLYQTRGITLDPREIFVSDGAKPDSANIQSIFDSESIVAVQDPVYPVYLDTSIINGRKVVFMKCVEENGFIPSPPGQRPSGPAASQKVDIIYLCSPNNPTGAVLTMDQLKTFVDYALEKKAVLIFDAAYFAFIQDESLPKSIYEIDGAKKCAIEINSFSKLAGFTGVRLGWSIVPDDLVVNDSKKGDIRNLWLRRQTTMFNGASNIAQEGGLAVLSPQGWKECMEIIDYYMQNARIIKLALEKLGLTAYGGDNAPYIWLKTPNNMDSWEFFDKLLNECNVVGTPGSGFGKGGQGFFRLSAFGHREDIEKAAESIKKNLKL